MKNRLLILSTFLVVFSSCKKDDDNSNPNNGNNGDTMSVGNPSAFIYLPNTKGSYWVYENYITDKNGVETNLGTTDSAYVVGDTIIGSSKYVGYYNISVHYPHTILYLRNDDGVLKNHYGGLFLPVKEEINNQDKPSYIVHDGDTFSSAYASSFFNKSVQTPTGNYDKAIELRNTYDIHPSKWQQGKPNSVTASTYFVQKVGIVKEEFFYISIREKIFDRRLVRYHIEP